jgi:Na+/melibiose symporter-like transporter
LKPQALAAYGLLALPLAMVALPVYIQVPSWYVDHVGMALPVTGYVLFGARILDTAQDPWLGRLVGRLGARGRLGAALWTAAAILAGAFAALWFPPVGGTGWLPVAWLSLTLALTYCAHSFLNITLLSWGARVSPDTRGRTRAGAWREAAGLSGVVIASLVPAWMTRASGWTPGLAMAAYAVGFAVLLAAAVAVLLLLAPPWRRSTDEPHGGAPASRPPVPPSLAPRQPALPAVRRLWLPYTVNALAVAIPATLALFFIRDQIARPQWTGAFLAAYFVAGAAGMPVWTRLAGKYGPARTWAGSMLVAICTFFWATLLGPGDTWPYAAVCVLSGLALGADLVLPPVLLANAVPPEHDPAAQFGIWTLLGKLATAVSALTLPLLAWLGYQPGTTSSGGRALILAYAVVPCALKLLALALLLIQVIPREEKPT